MKLKIASITTERRSGRSAGRRCVCGRPGRDMVRVPCLNRSTCHTHSFSSSCLGESHTLNNPERPSTPAISPAQTRHRSRHRLRFIESERVVFTEKTRLRCALSWSALAARARIRASAEYLHRATTWQQEHHETGSYRRLRDRHCGARKILRNPRSSILCGVVSLAWEFRSREG